MKFLFLINGLLFLGIFIYLLFNFFKHHNKKTEKITRLFSFVGLMYLFFSISSILWFFGVLNYLGEDFLFIYAIGLIFQSFILFRVVYLFSKNKRLRYFLVLYVLALAALMFLSGSFLVLSILASFLFTLLLSLEFIFIRGKYLNAGYFGILYSVVSMILYLSFFYSWRNLYSFSLISNLLFFFFMFIFLKDLEKYPLQETLKLRKQKSYFLSLLGHLIFIITLVNFVFIGTIGIHEFGHYGTSKLYGCEYQKIVYENDLFHTEILCGNSTSEVLVALGGPLAPLIIAGVLFFIGGRFMQEVALLMMGFDLISVSRDLGGIGVSENLIFWAISLGVLAVVYGIYLLARSRTDEDLYLDTFLAKSISTKKRKARKKGPFRRRKKHINFNV